MKAVLKKISVMFLVVVFFYGCKKVKEAEVLPIQEEPETVVRNDSIEIGNTPHLLIQNHNKNINGNSSHAEAYSVDVNQDGVNDFKLMSKVWGNDLGMEVPVTEVVCLHSSAMVNSQIRAETIYLKNETEIIHAAKVEKIIHRYYSCESNPGAVIYKTQEVLKPSFKEEFDFIRNADAWEGRSIVLTQGPYEHPLNELYHTSDSIVYQKIHYDMVCNEFPGNKVSYMGVKVKVGGVEKMGWLKMRITGFNKVFLIESAFEK